MLHLVGRDTAEERHVLKREHTIDGRQAAARELFELARGLRRVHRTIGFVGPLGQRREETTHEVGVVGEERAQLVDGQSPA